MTTPFKPPQPFVSPQRADESIRVIDVNENYVGCSWHYHPELQLCHVNRGSGERLIGDRMFPIEEGEVILLGANLPHVWRYDLVASGSIEATVVHFSESVLGRDWLQRPELASVRLLLARACQGLQVTGELRVEIANKIRDLRERQGLPRLIGLLETLHLLSVSNQLNTLSTNGYQPLATQLDLERMQRVCDYITEHIHESLDRDSMARMIHMSGSGFSRFFKAHTGMTFQEFVTDVRISKACLLLASSDAPITELATQCGYGELSTFNRAFKRYRNTTPTKYRGMVRSVMQENRPESLTFD